jgi:hypothetical protein
MILDSATDEIKRAAACFGAACKGGNSAFLLTYAAAACVGATGEGFLHEEDDPLSGRLTRQRLLLARQVKERQLAQSISCGKTFRGHTALKAFPAVHKWLGELGHELEERIAADRAENERVPRLLTVRTP